MNNDIKYIVESLTATHERTIKRLCIIIIFLILALIISNVVWICYENSFEDMTTIEQDADTEGENSSILQNVNGYGSITDGTRTSDNN